MALRTDGRRGMNLRHLAFTWIRREHNTLSHRWLPDGAR
jgi:hypothetical protein